MSKISRLPLSLACFGLLAASALADSVTLKSGERIDGKIANETATEMTIEIQMSAGIVDERVVKKADIEKVDRVAPDETAYRAIMNLQPGKNSLVPTQYDAILTKLQDFTAQHPQSSHAAEVKQATAAFQAEQKRVAAGEVKVEGLWLSKAEALKQRIQIGGLQSFNAMKIANASGDPIGALNAFAVLEKNYPGAKVVPDAVDLARQILVALKPVAERALENQKINEAERLKGVKTAGVSGIDGATPGKAIPDNLREQARVNAALAAAKQGELIAAHQREQAKFDAALAAASTAGLWPPFAPTSEKCLKAILAKIPTEAQRLEKIPVVPMRESIKLAEKAQTDIVNKDYDAATETLKQAAKLWPTNDLTTRLQAAIVAAKNPPKPDPAAPPLPEPPAPAAAGAATPAVRPPAATPAPATPPAAAAAKATPAPAPSTVASEPATPATAGKEKPFFMTIGGAITIVVLLAFLLAGANVFNKLRHRANDTLE